MKINLKQWMADFDNSENLFKMTIPGTHDCVTQYIQLSKICRCQDLNIYDQLSIGVRALDIRVQSSDNNRLGMVHGVAKAFNTKNHRGPQMDMADVLNYCYRFLDENPSEAIIFQFKNDSAKEQELCFNNMFYTYISANPERWYTKNQIPTLGEARGKIVFIRRCNMDKDNKDFTNLNTGIDFSSWVEQDTAEPHPLTLDTQSIDNASFVIQDRFKYKPEERWELCLKPFLDSMTQFKGEYIINYTSTAGGTKGPHHNSGIINKLFMDYPLDKEKYYGTIYLDFPFPELTTKIIEHNYKKDA